MRPLPPAARLWRSSLEAFAAFVLPAACPVCGGPLPGLCAGGVCNGCWSRLRPLRPPLCVNCGVPAPGPDAAEATCLRCLAAPPPFAALRAVAPYEGTAREIVRVFKFEGQAELDAPMARMMAAVWRADPVLRDRPALLVPVPQRLWKRRARGHDPARRLCRRLARGLGLPAAPRALAKIRRTPDQAGLPVERRLRNLAGAFRARRGAARMLAGRRILLIDDVVTTGATAAACSRALLDAGAMEVSVLAFARTPRGLTGPEGDRIVRRSRSTDGGPPGPRRFAG